jgi:hypothetical protein
MVGTGSKRGSSRDAGPSQYLPQSRNNLPATRRRLPLPTKRLFGIIYSERMNETKETNMTPRELRQMLFGINNQKMTVEQLRAILFTMEQDEELKPADVAASVNATEFLQKLDAENRY